MDITLIPGIMKAKNWDVGKRLMESWFSRPVAIKPGYGHPPEFVKMDWVLGFREAKSVYQEIFDKKIWSNEAAKKEVRKMLDKKGLLASGGSSFNYLWKPAPDLEDDYVNFRAIKSSGYYGYYGYSYTLYDDINDLTAALGRFVFRVAIAGEVEPNAGVPNTYKVKVLEVGVWVKDSYDFEGDQFLGFWDPDDNSVSVINFLSGDAVSNEDFRDWRSSHGMGGDFLVYSDVKIETLKTPDVFIV